MYILIFSIILLLLVVANIIFHCIGIHLLFVLKHNGQHTIHLMHLLNLCFLELFCSLVSLLTFVIKLIKFNDCTVAKEIEIYINTFKGCLLLPTYFLTMVVILIDKVLEIMMNIRYAVIWNKKKAKMVITIVWMSSAAFYLAVSIVYRTTKINIMTYYPKYLMLPANMVYVVFALASYAYIFYNFNKSRMLPLGKGNKQSFYQVFRKSRFFIPLTLILIYIIFQAIPTILFVLLTGLVNKTYIRLYIAFSYNVAMLFDSWICIFLEPRVKQQLIKMKIWRRDRKGIGRNGEQSKICKTDGIVDDYFLPSLTESPQTQI